MEAPKPRPDAHLRGAQAALEGGVEIQRGKRLGGSSSGGYSVYVALDRESGELLVAYEWVLPCRPARKIDSRRIKQVLLSPVYKALAY